jgi:predicted XRE-type DNA-binding protein
VRGKVELFSVDTLITMASSAELQIDLKIAKAA